MGYYVIGEDYVVGKAAMLSCVDSLEQRFDRMLGRIGLSDYRSGDGGKYHYDFVSGFLDHMKDAIEKWNLRAMNRDDFVEIAKNAADQIIADKKYTLEFVFTPDIVEGIAHFVEHKMPSFSALSNTSSDKSAGK